MKTNLIRAILGVLALAFATPVLLHAQAPTAPAQSASELSAAQLDQLLAPIALYPDELVGQILMAATYPIEVVAATRWMQDSNNARLKGDELTAALADKDWDPSVKSLIPFPQVLRMLDERLDWMQKLGDAFIAQQADVMDSVQRLRRQAEAAGTLKSSPQQTVTTQDQTITVEPANPNVVYVPVYDPTVVYGAWPYPDYPPYYFPPPPGFIFGPPIWPGFWWGPVIEIGFFRSYWGWDHFDWGRHRIGIDHDRFDRIDAHRPPFTGDTWQHDPYHRRGVAYRDPGSIAKFGRPVTGSPDARRVFRGYEGATGVATPRTFVKPGTTGAPTTQGTLSKQTPTIQRPPATAFEGIGRGPDIRAQSERGHASQQMIAPRSTGPSFSAPRSSGGAPQGGRSSGGGALRR
jgi:hypothetical protein